MSETPSAAWSQRSLCLATASQLRPHVVQIRLLIPSFGVGKMMYMRERFSVNVGNHTVTNDMRYFFFLSFFFGISWATPAAYGGSQARGLIGAVATSLCQRHSNAGSEPCLQPTSQLTAMPDL